MDNLLRIGRQIRLAAILLFATLSLSTTATAGRYLQINKERFKVIASAEDFSKLVFKLPPDKPSKIPYLGQNLAVVYFLTDNPVCQRLYPILEVYAAKRPSVTHYIVDEKLYTGNSSFRTLVPQYPYTLVCKPNDKVAGFLTPAYITLDEFCSTVDDALGFERSDNNTQAALDILVAGKSYELAKTVCLNMLDKNPNSFALLKTATDLSVELRQWDDVILYIKRRLAFGNGQLELYRQIIEACKYSNHTNAADVEEITCKMSQLKIGNAHDYMANGELLLEHELYTLALNAYTTALKLGADKYGAVDGIAQSLLEIDSRMDEAIPYFLQLINSDDNYWKYEGYFGIGKIYYKKQDYGIALQYFLKARELKEYYNEDLESYIIHCT